MPDAGRVAATLSAIRADIEETAAVYNLDGAGKNSYPVSVAMIRHARPLLAAVEAALEHHQRHDRGPGQYPTCTCTGSPVWPCKESQDIAAALTGTQPSEDRSDRG